MITISGAGTSKEEVCGSCRCLTGKTPAEPRAWRALPLLIAWLALCGYIYPTTNLTLLCSKWPVCTAASCSWGQKSCLQWGTPISSHRPTDSFQIRTFHQMLEFMASFKNLDDLATPRPLMFAWRDRAEKSGMRGPPFAECPVPTRAIYVISLATESPGSGALLSYFLYYSSSPSLSRAQCLARCVFIEQIGDHESWSLTSPKFTTKTRLWVAHNFIHLLMTWHSFPFSSWLREGN